MSTRLCSRHSRWSAGRECLESKPSAIPADAIAQTTYAEGGPAQPHALKQSTGQFTHHNVRTRLPDRRLLRRHDPVDAYVVCRDAGAGAGPSPEYFVECVGRGGDEVVEVGRSDEHTSELQSLMRISYAVF